MLEIAHEDRHLLVALKPAGLPTTSPGGRDSLTLRLERMRGRSLHPTSRLDAEVTGLVTYAKTPEAILALRRARSEGRYGRGYLAISSATPREPEGTWTSSIAIDPHDRTLRIAVDDPKSVHQRVQSARTMYRVRATCGGCAVLWLTPHTGRTHQLRVHAKHAGVPLLGDTRYGGEKRVALPDGRVVTARRTMLHCAWLRLPAIEAPGVLDLRAEAPPDLREVWTRLGGEGDALAITP